MLPRFLQEHVAGFIFTAMLMLIAVAAMNTQNNLLFWVLGVLVAALVVSAVISKKMMRALHVRRIDPQHGAVGEPLVVRYAVTNHSRWLAGFNTHIEERERRGLPMPFRRDTEPASTDRRARNWRSLMQPARAWIMHVGPRETVHGEAIFWPTRRGTVLLDQMRYWTTFPFGITRAVRITSQPQHTVIYPMLYQMRAGLLKTMMPKSTLGANVSPHSGAGDDFYGTREYKPGDGMRHIAWKLTARADELITIERTAPSPSKLRVILDLTTPTAKLHVEPNGAEDARELEEASISLAASLLHAADLEGFEIGLTILGSPGPPIAIRRNRWHFNKVMAALAEIDLDAPRASPPPKPVRDAERCAIIVVAPDRVRPLVGRDDAWHLTARQLKTLAVQAIGWNATAGDHAAAPAIQSSSAAAPNSAHSRRSTVVNAS